jgi:hypothetical protein
LIGTVLTLAMSAAPALADTLYGRCRHKDGSKAEATISTSWNGKKAYPKNGKYRLDFGKKVSAKVTVYVNGEEYTRLKVDGDTELNITVP